MNGSRLARSLLNSKFTTPESTKSELACLESVIQQHHVLPRGVVNRPASHVGGGCESVALGEGERERARIRGAGRVRQYVYAMRTVCLVVPVHDVPRGEPGVMLPGSGRMIDRLY